MFVSTIFGPLALKPGRRQDLVNFLLKYYSAIGLPVQIPNYRAESDVWM